MEFLRRWLLLGLALVALPAPAGSLDVRLQALVAERGLGPVAELPLAPLDDPLARLGRELFFTRGLSEGGDLACASCHHPLLGGGDGLSLPVGIHAARPEVLGLGRVVDPVLRTLHAPSALPGPNVPRNAPTTFNAALYERALFLDGRAVPGDAGTARFPTSILRHMLELGRAGERDPRGLRDIVLARLGGTSAGARGSGQRGSIPLRREWVVRFRTAFARGAATPEEMFTAENLTAALSRYLETQRLVDNPWSRYLRGDLSALTPEQKTGALLFYDHEDAGGCSSCHRGTRFTDERFHNLAFPRLGPGTDSLRQDFGRKRVSGEAGDKFAFRTPSLLNVEVTAPYGHAGSFATLAATLEHHARPEASLAGYGFGHLPQLAALGLEYPRARLNSAIAARYSNRGRVHPYSPEELSRIESFLRALTDPCMRSAACLARWLPPTDEPSPDGARLQARLLRLPPTLDEPPPPMFEEVSAALGVRHRFKAPSIAPERDGRGLDPLRLRRNQHLLATSGLAAGDVDGNGYPDLLLLGGKHGETRLYLNDAGRFRDATTASGIELEGNVNGATFVDLDGDGHLDLIVGGALEHPSGDQHDDVLYRVRAFRGNGRGRFRPMEVPEALAVRQRSMTSTAFGDYDLDGDLDMFVGYWEPQPGGGEENKLWENVGGGRFVPAHRRLGLGGQFRHHASFSPSFSDVNGDGWPDLLVVGDFETTQLFINIDGVRLENRTDPGVINDENGMGSAVGDYDNDGDLDWFVSSIYEVREPEFELARNAWGRSGNRLYENLGNGRFIDVTERAGVREGFWGWGSCFADFDLDGRLDIFVVNGWSEPHSPFLRKLAGQFFATPARLYISTGDRRFAEAAESSGIADRGEGRAVSCLDFDRDGDVDVVIVNAGQPTRIYQNRVREQDPANTRFLGVRLAGIGANREAVGARITVHTASGLQLRELRIGSNYLSQDPTEALFGLGATQAIERVVVRWPERAGTVTEHRDIAPDRWITLTHP